MRTAICFPAYVAIPIWGYPLPTHPWELCPRSVDLTPLDFPDVPIPDTKPSCRWFHPPPAFSANGSKFAVIAYDGTMCVWDFRNKIPLMVKEPDRYERRVDYLKFSSGNLGREVLAFLEVSQLCLDFIFFMLNKLLVGQRLY